MRKYLLASFTVLAVVAALTVSLSSHAQSSNAGGGSAPSGGGSVTVTADTLSYALGYNIGARFKEQDINIKVDLLREGIEAGLGQREPRLSEETMKQVLDQFQKQLQEKYAKEMKAEGERQKRQGAAFLQENKKKASVKETSTGLQYQVVKEGDGPSPDENDLVIVHYTGTFIDGTVFDSSRQRGRPFITRVDQPIGGWTEGLQLMKQGGRYKLFVPPELAYGENGSRGGIPPNATLVFDIELLEVRKVDEQAGGGARP